MALKKENDAAMKTKDHEPNDPQWPDSPLPMSKSFNTSTTIVAIAAVAIIIYVIYQIFVCGCG